MAAASLPPNSGEILGDIILEPLRDMMYKDCKIDKFQLTAKGSPGRPWHLEQSFKVGTTDSQL